MMASFCFGDGPTSAAHYGFMLLALLSLISLRLSWHGWCALKNAPVSTVATAAPGLVELAGIADLSGETPVLSHWKQRPCLWCRYEMEERVGGSWMGRGWSAVDSGETGAAFVLRDATGFCVIDPASAEIVTRHRARWTLGHRRYTEWTLRQGDALRVIGLFRAPGAQAEPWDASAALATCLAGWKKELPHLFSRFDLHQDSLLGRSAWSVARRQAMRAVLQDRKSHSSPSGPGLGSGPVQGAFFLVATASRNGLMCGYMLAICVHSMVFVGSLCGLVRMLQCAVV